MNERYLLDSNALIAIATPDHVHHSAMNNWYKQKNPQVLTCPITQGALVRVFCLTGGSQGVEDAIELLQDISRWPNHQFIACDLHFENFNSRGILGHKQVTDAYIAQLAIHHEIKVATFDKALAALYPDSAELIA